MKNEVMKMKIQKNAYGKYMKLKTESPKRT